MILDTLEHLDAYRTLIPIADEARVFLKDAGSRPVGRYELGGGYVLVQEGETRPASDALYEAHNCYVDFQVVADGCEYLGWAERSALSEDIPYSAEQDIVFFRDGGKACFCVRKGMFYVMFPGDAHQPCIHIMEKSYYRKYVFKFKVF